MKVAITKTKTGEDCVTVTTNDTHIVITEFEGKTSLNTKNKIQKVINSQTEDELLPQALELCKKEKTNSPAFLQRRLGIGYARASRLSDQIKPLLL